MDKYSIWLQDFFSYTVSLPVLYISLIILSIGISPIVDLKNMFSMVELGTCLMIETSLSRWFDLEGSRKYVRLVYCNKTYKYDMSYNKYLFTNLLNKLHKVSYISTGVLGLIIGTYNPNPRIGHVS